MKFYVQCRPKYNIFIPVSSSSSFIRAYTCVCKVSIRPINTIYRYLLHYILHLYRCVNVVCSLLIVVTKPQRCITLLISSLKRRQIVSCTSHEMAPVSATESDICRLHQSTHPSLVALRRYITIARHEVCNRLKSRVRGTLCCLIATYGVDYVC